MTGQASTPPGITREDVIAEVERRMVSYKAQRDYWRNLYIDDNVPDPETLRAMDEHAAEL